MLVQLVHKQTMDRLVLVANVFEPIVFSFAIVTM